LLVLAVSKNVQVSACRANEEMSRGTCVCSAGYFRSLGTLRCVACDAGHFKEDIGEGHGRCLGRCALHYGSLSTSPSGSSRKEDCVCSKGSYMDGHESSLQCKQCEVCDAVGAGQVGAWAEGCSGGRIPGTYTNNTHAQPKRKVPCQMFVLKQGVATCPAPVPVESSITVSLATSSENISDLSVGCASNELRLDPQGLCQCDKGYYRSPHKTCLPCSPGYFKETIGDGIGQCISRCSWFFGYAASSPVGSSSRADCFCRKGSFMSRAASGMFCKDCNHCSHGRAQCPGGISKDGNHNSCSGPIDYCKAINAANGQLLDFAMSGSSHKALLIPLMLVELWTLLC